MGAIEHITEIGFFVTTADALINWTRTCSMWLIFRESNK